MRACVPAMSRMHAYVCMCECVSVRVHACACVCMRACVLSFNVRTMYGMWFLDKGNTLFGSDLVYKEESDDRCRCHNTTGQLGRASVVHDQHTTLTTKSLTIDGSTGW